MTEKSEYYKKLLDEHPDVAARYVDKISKINGVDPFSLNEQEVNFQAKNFPPVTNMDIVSYLVLTMSFYTSTQMKAYKSLLAYKYFEAGFVHKCGATKINNYIVVVGRVKHSQKMQEKPLHVWVMCHMDGSIETAHCTCMAGSGEVCSHVGAILYALEHVHTSLEGTSCTDVSAVWNVPKMTKIEYSTIKNMDFGRITKSHSVSDVIPAMSATEMVEFFENIEETGSSSVLMRVLEPFASKMEVIEEQIVNIYSNRYKSEYEMLSYQELLQQVMEFKAEISIEDCHKIEEATRKQSQSAMWFQQRAGRITASNFKAVCRTSLQTPSLSLIKMICYPTSFLFKTKATVWGSTHEAEAIATYQTHCAAIHPGLQVERVGLCLSPEYPEFGASPDGIVTCSCCGSGCVEVKCPYVLKELSLEQFSERKSSCLGKTENSELYLKRDHSYYYQIQMQLAILGMTFCDFIIWSPREFYLQRITFDEEFWTREAAKAQQFHKQIVLPELYARFYSRNESTSETWCVCQGVDDGRPMLCCDNDDCNIKWHHLECIGLLDIPEQSWYCPNCRDLL